MKPPPTMRNISYLLCVLKEHAMALKQSSFGRVLLFALVLIAQPAPAQISAWKLGGRPPARRKPNGTDATRAAN